MKIENIRAYWILDSRGNPTIEVAFYYSNFVVFGSSPSGASTGIKEAVEIRDNDEDFHGKGVKKAIDNVYSLKNEILSMDFSSPKEFDLFLIEKDGTMNKSNLGGNVITALSITFVKLFARVNSIPIWKVFSSFHYPKLMFNIINGGKHSGNSLSIQEFMIVPQFELPSENIKAASEIYHNLKTMIKKEYGSIYTSVGDEGGFSPPIQNTEEALYLLERAIEESSYKGSVKVSLDCAADSFFDEKNNKYVIDGKVLEGEELVDYYNSLRFDIFSIEDPFFEKHNHLFSELKSSSKFKIVGDDLTVTNKELIEQSHNRKEIDGAIIKINQVGTVSEATEALRYCKENSLLTIVSHRSGDREDSFISDFAVGNASLFMKTGAPARGERTAKYNRLLRIENTEGER